MELSGTCLQLESTVSIASWASQHCGAELGKTNHPSEHRCVMSFTKQKSSNVHRTSSNKGHDLNKKGPKLLWQGRQQDWCYQMVFGISPKFKSSPLWQTDSHLFVLQIACFYGERTIQLYLGSLQDQSIKIDTSKNNIPAAVGPPSPKLCHLLSN